jgi:sugar lactone lactonase YvrE
MRPFFLRIHKTLFRSRFWFALLLGLLPFTLLAQFCSKGITVAGGNSTGDAFNQFHTPDYILVDGVGNLYVSDYFNHRVLIFPPNSTSTTMGIVVAGGNGSGSALNQLNSPEGIALDKQGNLYVSDYLNRRVLKFPPNSTSATIGTVVATGHEDTGEPGQFSEPNDIALDKEGNLYVCDVDQICKFPPNSTSATAGTTVAGGNGQFGRSYGIGIDGEDNLYVADGSSNRVLKFPPNSTSATMGTVVAGDNGEGKAANQFNFPQDIIFDGVGNLYVSDNVNHRVQFFPPGSTSATAGITVAGTGKSGTGVIQLKYPVGLSMDEGGYLYVADTYNERIQRFSPGNPTTFIGEQPTSQTVCVGATVTTTVSVSGTASGYQWYKDDVSLGDAQQQATLTLTNIQSTDAGSYYVIVTGCTSATSTPFTLTINTPPTVSISPSVTSVCASSPALLTASEADIYLWSTGETTASISVTATGPYSVTGTTSTCSATATAQVTVYPSAPTPVLSVSPSDGKPIFQNTPYVTLTISGCEGGILSWQGPGGASGSSTTISVPTSATGTLVYSATCTVGSCTSLPGAATVIISSPSEIGSFDGFIYGADCSTFRGWAWDRNKPNTVQSVQILDGPKVIATIAANEFRQDLKDAGKGNGIHAFRWSIPTELKDGQVHYLSARVSNSSFILKDSPKALICEGGTVPPPTNKQPVPPTMTPLVAQQGVAFTTTLPVFTDPEGITLSYGLVTLPTGLSFTSASRQIQGTPTASGLFVLTYSATDDKGATNSVSFNLTVNPTATTPVTGSFEGYLDKVECGTIRGWVWDRNKPNTPVTVEFYTGSTVWGSVVANIYRDDLKNANKGNGAHAYSFTVPAELKDGNTRLIRARVSGSTYDLKDSGKPLTCSSPVRLSAESNEGLQVTVLGNPVSDQLELKVRGAEGQQLRFQLTDATGRLVSQRQIEVAKPVEQQTFSVSQQPPGLLLLRVSNGSKSLTLKVIKQ